ncbi:MAG: tRNA lysidine(34) synthetase TilS [Bdellovibrionales bacterium]|nr:tRNA lysidine(34) synthetase TilS [Bdellovibrionales bacterium]
MKSKAEDLLFAALKRALAELRQRQPGTTPGIIAAVSGGVDSIVLLDGLLMFHAAGVIRVAVGHFDHGLRQGSAAEAEFVKRRAESAGVPYFGAEAPALPPRVNLEAWARSERYRFLEEARCAAGVQWIATAHHRDDQAETLLMRLLSGRLATDAHSIAALGIERGVVRPLLDVSRAVILQYARERRLPYVIDGSNFDLRRTRNRIRHDVLPALRAGYSPNIVDSLATTAGRLSRDESFLWEQAEELAAAASASVEAVRGVPPALRWRVLRVFALKAIGPEAGRIGYRALEKAVQNIGCPLGAERTIELGFGYRLRIDRHGELTFEGVGNLGEMVGVLSPQTLSVPGSVQRVFEDGTGGVVEANLFPVDLQSVGRWRAEARRAAASGAGEPRAYFDFDELQRVAPAGVLRVRSRHPGDSVRVWARGQRKVKKLLQERGLKLTVRDRIPIVEFGQTIVWVPGVARSDVAPIRDSSSNLLELVYRVV